MAKIKVTKIDGARRQIKSAMRMSIYGEDTIAIHILASASWKILRDLGRNRPIPATDTGSTNEQIA